MKTSLRYILMIMVLTLSSATIAQWQKSEGLDGGKVHDVLVLDSLLFATGAETGVYKRAPGNDWEVVLDEMVKELIHIDNSILAFGFSDCIISQDYGLSWNEIDNLLDADWIGNIGTALYFFERCSA